MPQRSTRTTNIPQFGLSRSDSPVSLSVGKERCLRSLAHAAKVHPLRTMQQTLSEIAGGREGKMYSEIAISPERTSLLRWLLGLGRARRGGRSQTSRDH